MHLEWPHWQGPELPLELRTALQTEGQHCGSATLVRHSLRRIYAKTNISNKAELANLLGTSA
jgi:hypothetical protein